MDEEEIDLDLEEPEKSGKTEEGKQEMGQNDDLDEVELMKEVQGFFQGNSSDQGQGQGKDIYVNLILEVKNIWPFYYLDALLKDVNLLENLTENSDELRMDSAEKIDSSAQNVTSEGQQNDQDVIKRLEEDRGKLTAEILQKEEKMSQLEQEVASLKVNLMIIM